MQKTTIRPSLSPIKLKAVRMDAIWENTDPCIPNIEYQKGVIKDYVYSAKKRVIA